ncbi:hypothetical protein HY573_01740, partial [Candidatus Parcubacteria bacterium]|nr:hypothetical protein [Candidatus Parcubacteria bacterium]
MFSFRIVFRLGEERAQTSIATVHRTVGLGVILAALALALFVFIPGASAAPNPFDITFPIPELGNCGSIDQCKTYCDSLDHAADCSVFAQKHGLASDEQVKKAEALPDQGPGGCNSESSCKTYCDDPDKTGECLSFAEEHDLIPKEDIRKARVLATKTGPGGCRGEACRTYCDDAARQDECFKFAEDNGLLGAREIEEVKKGREVLQRFGTGPGGCKSERECRTYCDSGDNVEECVAFGERAGFLSKEEAARLRGLAGSGPGGCRGKDQCQAYCDSAENAQECLTYAVEHNLISKEEGERARKIAGKTGPGGCRGESACRAYCGDPAHGDECLAFAEENGFLPKEEIERARKFRSLASQAGPGGCQGETACRAYCENPSNRDACFKFAGEQGLVPPEEIKRFERGRSLEDRVKKEGGPGGCRDEASCAQYCSDSSNAVGCLNFAVEYGGFSREEAQRSLDEFTRYREYSQTVRSRPDLFLGGPEAGQFGPPIPQLGAGPTTIIIYQQGFPPPPSFGGPGTGYGGFSGPGGCSSPQACAQYCSTHESECRNFYRSGEPQRQEFVAPAAAAVEFGPGGCRGLSECLRYCQDPGHRAECSSFGGTQGGLPTPTQFPGAPGQFPGAPGAFPAPQDAPRFCPQIFEPVCGVNNVTYGNRCEAGYIPVSYNGACRSGPQPGPLPGGCTTEECVRQYCSEPSRSGVGECARFSSGQQQQTCPAGYRPVPTPQSGFYCAPETATPTASACVSSQTCEAVCYNASTPDYGTNACIAFRQSRPSPPSTSTCPQGQYWYVPPAGGSGYCLSNNTLPPPACPANQYWNGVSCVGTSAGGCTSEASCSIVCYDSASPEYNSSSCAGYRQSRSSTPTTSSCDQALTNLLGSGCHYMYNDSAGNQIYCDGSMTRSAKRGDA